MGNEQWIVPMTILFMSLIVVPIWLLMKLVNYFIKRKTGRHQDQLDTPLVSPSKAGTEKAVYKLALTLLIISSLALLALGILGSLDPFLSPLLAIISYGTFIVSALVILVKGLRQKPKKLMDISMIIVGVGVLLFLMWPLFQGVK